MLLILDGWGVSALKKGNAIKAAYKPFFDSLWNEYPHTTLEASGQYVGLPEGRPGNSEAGHITIGAGRLVLQDETIINRAIGDGTFFENPALLQTFKHVKKNKSRLHVVAMVADGCNPHSCVNHIQAVIAMAKKQKIMQVFLHVITDGRDSPQRSAGRLIHDLLESLHKLNSGYDNFELVTIVGRFYAMDRAQNWKRTEIAYNCLVNGDCVEFPYYKNALEYAYSQGVTDEYLEPMRINRGRKGYENSRIDNNDGVVFTNLRSDRARQLTKPFVQKQFNKANKKAFHRKKVLKNILFCALTDFGEDLNSQLVTAFPSEQIKYALPKVLEDFRQLYIAEAEKYAHMTYFINGGFGRIVNGERRVRVPSSKIKSFKNNPKMSAGAITKRVVSALDKKQYDFIAVNFANTDVVAHTGDILATIEAIEFIDTQIKLITRAVLQYKGTLIITSDHGNAEKMIDPETKEIYTGHTTNPVPFILVSSVFKKVKLQKGSLENIAPTVYDILAVTDLPREISASLIKH